MASQEMLSADAAIATSTSITIESVGTGERLTSDDPITTPINITSSSMTNHSDDMNVVAQERPIAADVVVVETHHPEPHTQQRQPFLSSISRAATAAASAPVVSALASATTSSSRDYSINAEEEDEGFNNLNNDNETDATAESFTMDEPAAETEEATTTSSPRQPQQQQQQQSQRGTRAVPFEATSKKTRLPYFKYDASKITLRFLFANRDGLTVTMECDPSDTIGEVKQSLLSVWPSDLPVCSNGDAIRFVCMGRGYLAPDSKTLEECLIPTFKSHPTPVNVALRPDFLKSSLSSSPSSKKKDFTAGHHSSGGAGLGGSSGGSSGNNHRNGSRRGRGSSSRAGAHASNHANGGVSQGCTCTIL